MRTLPLLIAVSLLLGFVGCTRSTSIVVLGDHTTAKDLRKAQFFSWNKHTHVLNIGYVGTNGVTYPSEAKYLYSMANFDPALAAQQYRPNRIGVSDLMFSVEKGQIPPEEDRVGWMDTLFQAYRHVRLFDSTWSEIADIEIYLPPPLDVSVEEHNASFSFQWRPDSLNPNGLSIWINAVRGPNTGYRGKLKGFNQTYNADDRIGKVSIQKEDLPPWVWEDPQHTSLSIFVFRRTTEKGEIEGVKQNLRVVATQSMKFAVLTPKH